MNDCVFVFWTRDHHVENKQQEMVARTGIDLGSTRFLLCTPHFGALFFCVFIPLTNIIARISATPSARRPLPRRLHHFFDSIDSTNRFPPTFSDFPQPLIFILSPPWRTSSVSTDGILPFLFYSTAPIWVRSQLTHVLFVVNFF
jgi:hypothetical protein